MTAAATDAFESATRSEAETEAAGEALGAVIEAGDLVTLTGPLGAGKTRLVAGVARGAGCRSRVRSPSFALVNEYRATPRLAHLDLYRLEGAEPEGLGLEELRDRAALLVEWGEKLPGAWRAEALRVELAPLGANERRLRAEADAPRARALLAAWRARLESRAAGGA